MTILDLRPTEAYEMSHARDSYNIPLSQTKQDFFGDANAIEKRWVELRAALEGEEWTWQDNRQILVVCEDGDSSRMATAMLRAKGKEAFCIEGGYPAFHEWLQNHSNDAFRAG